MARVARVHHLETFPIREIEPNMLNAAYQKQRLGSVPSLFPLVAEGTPPSLSIGIVARTLYRTSPMSLFEAASTPEGIIVPAIVLLVVVGLPLYFLKAFFS
jgi:hypothetical protein